MAIQSTSNFASAVKESKFRRSILRITICVLALILVSSSASGWSLKTHIWIAQQVLNDILFDGKVTIAGREYPVSERVLKALREHPDKYRMGALGPDVFPDPIVGQTTTHPGVDGGWQTDEWLQHLLNTAQTPEEVAFAYGFTAHASGDIFAHTYVNAYAGDIFSLIDSERDIELRHFVLEKYIESLTPHPHTADGIPLDWKEALGTPVKFVRNTLILNGKAARENLRAKTGAHLAAMYGVQQGVKGLDEVTEKLIAKIVDGTAKYYKMQADMQIDLATGKQTLQAAEANLKLQGEILELKKKALSIAIGGLRDAKDIVKKNPSLINMQTEILSQHTKVTIDAAAESIKLAEEANKAVSDAAGALSNLQGEAAKFLCNLIVWDKEKRDDCKDEVDKVNKKISDINNYINGKKARAYLAKEAADNAEKYQKNIKTEIDRLKEQYNEAMIKILDGSLEAATSVAEADVKLQENILKTATKTVNELQKVQNKLANEIKDLDILIDQIAEAIKRYNAVGAVINNWLTGIENASDEYVVASHEAGIKMLGNSGNPLEDYTRWLKCYGFVYVGMPIQVGDGLCATQDFVKDVREKYHKAIDELPELLQWMIRPSKEASELAQKKLSGQIEKAKFELLKFTTDKVTAEFLLLLSTPENATKSKLNSVYKRDNSGKNLLRFEQVASIVEKDLLINNGFLDTEKFRPLLNSITLSKLTLLDHETINQVINDCTNGQISSYFGKDVYGLNDKGTILNNAIRSIDGNHQWQAYGLPYPRNTGISPLVNVKKNNYGYDYYKYSDRSKGFKIWVDPFLREKVFKRLFPGSMLGSLSERAELQRGLYNFSECEQNTYPSTQDINGVVLTRDWICDNVSETNLVSNNYFFNNSTDYSKIFFQCDTLIDERPSWTVVGSFLSEKMATKQKNKLANLFPDIYTEVWSPVRSNKYWTIMMASCTTNDKALQARNIAIRRGIALDAFVWRPTYPWRPVSPPAMPVVRTIQVNPTPSTSK
jgi:hypothetical protein